VEILSWLRTLSQFEADLADLYAWLSESYKEDDEASFVFYRLSRDERAHVDIIDFVRRVVRRDTSPYPGVEVDAQELASAHEQVKTLRRLPQPPPVDQALAAAVEFEAIAAEVHLRSALKESNPEMTRLLASLGKDDRLHGARLAEVVAKRGATSASAAPLGLVGELTAAS
jgi:hypothetical protein